MPCCSSRRSSRIWLRFGRGDGSHAAALPADAAASLRWRTRDIACGATRFQGRPQWPAVRPDPCSATRSASLRATDSPSGRKIRAADAAEVAEMHVSGGHRAGSGTWASSPDSWMSSPEPGEHRLSRARDRRCSPNSARGAGAEAVKQGLGLNEHVANHHGSNGRYSIKLDRPMMSTMVTANSAPWASVSRIGLPGRNGTGCCRPSSMAMLSA